jgi:hypothetical protein
LSFWVEERAIRILSAPRRARRSSGRSVRYRQACIALRDTAGARCRSQENVFGTQLAAAKAVQWVKAVVLFPNWSPERRCEHVVGPESRVPIGSQVKSSLWFSVFSVVARPVFTPFKRRSNDVQTRIQGHFRTSGPKRLALARRLRRSNVVQTTQTNVWINLVEMKRTTCN